VNAERWRQIQKIFDDALKQELQARGRFLDRACSDDPSLRNEVEALLRSHSPASTFLDPAPQKGLTAPDVKPTDGMIETSGNSFCRAINKRLMASTVRNYEARK
jgi:hypothetical protein